jgi:hypothetical protein
VESSPGISRLERSLVLRLVAAVSLAGLTGVVGPSGKPFDTLNVGWDDIDMASLDLLLGSSACSSEGDGDIDAL